MTNQTAENSSYSIYKIDTMQSGDINHIADNIYFAGCGVGCPFCFNPEIAKGMGKYMSLEEIYSSLSDVQWVCLMGGEPLESRKSLHILVRYLRKRGKKVVLFTSYSKPWQYVVCDHYHIDVKILRNKVAIFPPFNSSVGPQTVVSYGLVSYKYVRKEVLYAFRDVRSVPIYIKSNLIQTEYDGEAEYEALNSIGCRYLYKDRKIEVD